jgi:hypothetical protein
MGGPNHLHSIAEHIVCDHWFGVQFLSTGENELVNSMADRGKDQLMTLSVAMTHKSDLTSLFDSVDQSRNVSIWEAVCSSATSANPIKSVCNECCLSLCAKQHLTESQKQLVSKAIACVSWERGEMNEETNNDSEF